MSEKTRVCRRCLLEDMADQRPLYELIQEYIASLPRDTLTDTQTKCSRLAICRQCDHLFNGTCAKCGCYVEIRSARKDKACPDVPPRW